MKFKYFFVLVIAFLVGIGFGCGSCDDNGKKEPAEKEDGPGKEHKVVREALTGGPYPTLLVGQAQFDDDSNPLPAKMILLRQTGPEIWKEVVVEDPMSNVFHKVMPYNMEGEEPGILTIGAQKAALKIWRFQGGKWEEELLWQPSFGGKFDRLRDIEIGDVTGDGKPEMVIATHDQGVVAVLMKKDGKWEPTEMDRKPSTFVHEVEIGDVDGDGLNEFFVTPSDPNKADHSQAGMVAMYRWDGKGFKRTIVDKLENTHVKEILAVDLEGKGTATLFSVLEAEKEVDEWGDNVRVKPVRIRRYTFEKDKITGKDVAELDDDQCRFLCPGDINSDGRIDLVAAGMGSGLWIFWAQEDGSWKPERIDGDSSGFEHTTLIADLNEDGNPEIYVAADEQKFFRRYTYSDGKFDRDEIRPISGDVITWNLMPGKF